MAIKGNAKKGLADSIIDGLSYSWKSESKKIFKTWFLSVEDFSFLYTRLLCEWNWPQIWNKKNIKGE